MGYNEIIDILRGTRGGNAVTKPLEMSNTSNYDERMAINGTMGGTFREISKPLPTEERISLLEKLKTRIERDMTTLYGVSVPEIATYGIVERTFGLGTDNPNKYIYINATLPNLLVYVARGFMPLIPSEEERVEIYRNLVELSVLYQEDPSSLVQITLDEDLSSAIGAFKSHIEENYKSMFMKPDEPTYTGLGTNAVYTGLSDGLFTSNHHSLLGNQDDILETARLADGSMESNFQGEDESFGTDALSAYFNK